jgi:uncharacterized protein (TIGR02147 family)
VISPAEILWKKPAIDLSAYMDYRKFLKDYYEASKTENPHFSYCLFSRKAGISSKGLLYNVLQGKRHLSKAHVVGMCRALKLDRHQCEYFENLVAYNSVRRPADRKYFFDRLTSIKASGHGAWKPQLVRKEQYQLYSQWYHAVVRSLIDLYGYCGDYRELSRRLFPAVSPGKVRKSVALLERLGFIRRDEAGGYVLVDKSIATAPEVVSLAVLDYHAKAGELAIKALMELPRSKRNFSAVTLGISEATYDRMCQEIEEFRLRLQRLAEEDCGADRVYQLNFQLFPVSVSESSPPKANVGAKEEGMEREVA